MNTSTVELHFGKLNINAKKGGKRLFIDLDICNSGKCEACDIQCSYFYHNQNNGIISVAELATYYLICRKCEEPHCVNACPREALEQQKEKGNLLIRHSMRCISCKSCSLACPYGTIYPENVPYITHVCDYCLDRRDMDNEPLCIRTCRHKALSLIDSGTDLPENTWLAGDNIVVHSTHWRQETN
ncbi:MAG: 4Fe-4S binding protein [Spirochaetales bacterium]|nr:4Fe-4S binding protein [Spirochaetales bacterium]